MRSFIVPTVVALLLPIAASAAGKNIQCWTDDKGHRSCGDYVPPQYAKKEVQILNERGLVVEKKAREKTAAEIEEDDRKAKEAINEAQNARKRAAYDRFLIDTYSSVQELEKARDIRVQTLDARIRLAEKAVADNQKTLEDLRGRAAKPPVVGANPKAVEAIAKANERLKKQIETFEKTLADNTLATTTMQQEREQTLKKFAEDIQRWQELKAPAPAALTP